MTIDAMGCQAEIVEEIREQRGHSVLAVKGNQPTWHADLPQAFEDGLNTACADDAHDTHTSVETTHGRLTERTDAAIEIPHDHPQRERWRDLLTHVLTTSCVSVGEEETWQTRMSISALRPRAQSLGAAVRRHWGIKDGRHWELDVSYPRSRRWPTGRPWHGEPRRHSPPDRQPAPPGGDVEARCESQMHGLRARCQVSPRSVGHR